MTTPWRKVIRDFRLEIARTALVVLAIALGISGFTAVLASYAILTRELDNGYLATNPASATLRTDAVDDELLQEIVTGHGVSDAEARKVVTGRIKAGPVEWRGLTLFVVKDFGEVRIGKVEPQEGAWPPATGEILIERDALKVARTHIGESVTVRTARGSERVLRVSGTVKDVGQAQARMENIVYGYITRDTLSLLGEEPVLDQVNILVAENRFDEPHVRGVAADVKALVESRGHPVRRMDVPTPGKHPHASIMGFLLLAMAAFGLLVLALSGVVVVNLMTALMASQVRQIGVMKAIGGTRAQIARIYFSQALLLGAAAILLAVPAGILGSRVLCRYEAVFLNFDITSFAIPLWVYALVAAVGLAVPLVAAAVPVWKGSAISVREALADFGVSRSSFGTSSFDRLLAGIGGMTRPLLLAIRNSFRRRTRLALTVMTLAVGGLFFMTALNVRASLVHTLDRLFRSKKYDLQVGLGTMVPLEKIERAARNTPGVLRVEGWITTEASVPEDGDAAASGTPESGNPHAPAKAASGLHGGGANSSERFPVIALPAETQMQGLDIVEGRGLEAGDLDAIVVNTAVVAKYPAIKLGAAIALGMGPSRISWRVVGIAREPFSPPVAYVPLAFFDQHGHAGMVNSIRLSLDKTDADSISRVRGALEQNLEKEDVRALGSLSKTDSRYGFDQHMLMIYVFLIVMSAIIGGVGGLGLMTTMSLNVLERRREMGVLRAIGATPVAVGLIVVAEGGVIGVASWALASLAAWPVSKALGNLMVMMMFKSGLDFSFEPLGSVVWLAVSVVLGAVASFLPAWHASHRPVREALGYE